MKKIILPFLLLCSVTGFAQRFQVGLKVGANISNFSGSSDIEGMENESITSFHGGGFLSLFFGEKFILQPELLFSSQGAKIKTLSSDFESYTVNYINVPVMAKYKFKNGFYIEAGPQLGIKVGENIPETFTDQSSEDFYNSIDLSAGVGLGIHSKSGFGIGARYLIGMSKLSDPQIDPDFKNSYKNAVLQFSLFYSLFNK